MDNIKIGEQEIGGDSKIKLSINTLIKIIGGISIVINLVAGWAFYELRTEFRANNGISAEEKKEFLEDVEDKYDGKFDKMFEDISDIKGDIKVILDRANRINPVQPNPNTVIQPNTNFPPTTN